MKWRSLQEPAAESETRLLRQIFAERKELIAKYVPAEIQAVHQRTVTALKSQSLATKALGLGETAPMFELSDHNGKRVSSASLLAQGPLVICFIRGRWCSFDVGQMELMSTLADQIAAAGASLVAISPQIEKQ